jgi:hypothetical protein
MIGTLRAIIGTLRAIIVTLRAIIGTLGASIGTLRAIIVTAVGSAQGVVCSAGPSQIAGWSAAVRAMMFRPRWLWSVLFLLLLRSARGKWVSWFLCGDSDRSFARGREVAATYHPIA